MRIVDLSMTIQSDLTTQRAFSGNVLVNLVSHEESRKFAAGTPEDPFTSTWNYLSMTEHCGTHVDAFYHMDPNGLSVDEMDLDFFFGKAVCLDLTHLPPRAVITPEMLESAEKKAGITIDGHIVLLATGLHRQYYPDPVILEMNAELSSDAVYWLHEHGSRVHGVEGASTDILDKNTFPSHRACRDLKMAHYEWLVNLEELIGKGEFMFYGVPLKLKRGSGSPVRAFAVLEDEQK